MALSVCLLLDPVGERAVRQLWTRLETQGVTTLQTHTHGRHHPHLTFASLRSYDLVAVQAALGCLAAAEPTTLQFDGLGMFRRSRCWLLPAVSPTLVARQEAVATALASTGADLHRHYLPGTWMPHLTLAPRVHLDQLSTIARAVFEVLPLTVMLPRVALVDTSNGTVHPAPHLV
ncbi:MAG: 2'-5' RNA ligase family protein [Nocardioidaceae bacterium]